MQKLWTVLPIIVLLTGCGSAPSTNDTNASAPQATASSSVKKVAINEIPEADPQPQVRVQKASYRAKAAPNLNKSLSTDITSVVFSRTSNPRTPMDRWLQKELRLNSDLTVTLTDYNKQGRVVGKKTGRLAAEEYLALVGALKGAQYQTLNPIKRPKVLAGNVTDIITISTAKDFRQIKEDERQQFPAVIQTIFTRYTKAR